MMALRDGRLRAWCAAALLWLSAVALLPSAALGAAPADLYEVFVPVTEDRDAALAAALRTVVIRVSGRRDAPDRLGDALASPWNYAQRSGLTADGMLQVGFDSLSIDRLLTGAGLPVWGRERPATLVWLQVQDRDGTAFWLGADTLAIERDALERAAHERGVPLIWPALDFDERQTMHAQAGDDELLRSAARYGANAVLLGRARRDGGEVSWTLLSGGETRHVTGSLEDGVHLAADTFAALYAATGSSLQEIGVEVAGISNLDAYAATLNYLENMTLVRSVTVDRVAGDRVRFRLAVRGDEAALLRALALDTRLAPAAPTVDRGLGADAAAAAGAPLQLRYQP
ncbi:MAG: hypothetical protein DIU71_15110 [Proteobacteria bacterium]|nr:MAG: hypothetical protein DIU71_15110 [Pseudomonadota bacterium]